MPFHFFRSDLHYFYSQKKNGHIQQQSKTNTGPRSVTDAMSTDITKLAADNKFVVTDDCESEPKCPNSKEDHMARSEDCNVRKRKNLSNNLSLTVK